MATITPAELARLNENLAEVADQVTEFVAVHKKAMGEEDGTVGALLHTSQVILDEGYSPDDLVRLLAFAVARLAGGA